jgi:hypothetical protein
VVCVAHRLTSIHVLFFCAVRNRNLRFRRHRLKGYGILNLKGRSITPKSGSMGSTCWTTSLDTYRTPSGWTISPESSHQGSRRCLRSEPMHRTALDTGAVLVSIVGVPFSETTIVHARLLSFCALLLDFFSACCNTNHVRNCRYEGGGIRWDVNLVRLSLLPRPRLHLP